MFCVFQPSIDQAMLEPIKDAIRSYIEEQSKLGYMVIREHESLFDLAELVRRRQELYNMEYKSGFHLSLSNVLHTRDRLETLLMEIANDIRSSRDYHFAIGYFE